MKILFVSSGNSGEEISPIIKNQGESLRKSGLQVDFFTINGKGLWSYLKHIFLLIRLLKNSEYDIIHAHYSLSGYVAAFAGHRPLVVSLMGSEVKSKSTLRYILRIFIVYFWSITIVKSEDMKSTLGLKNVIVIPNGVDIDKFRHISKCEALEITGWNKGKKHILFAAKADRWVKNYKLAEEACLLLTDNDFELHTIGSIPNVDMPYYLNASDVVLLSSLWEGSPNVIKEAMSCNRPIVSTCVGDVKQVIGLTDGCFISKSNAEDLADKIQQALLFARFNEQTNGRNRILEAGLDSKSIAKKIKDVYLKVYLNDDRS